jgi:hypothetical protein
MKTIKALILVMMAFGIGACEYDNYDGPGSKFEGRVVYQGAPLNLDSRDLKMELWEIGWKKKTKIDVQVGQDGTFSALLFDGDYKLYIPRNTVPFKVPLNEQTQSDTLRVEIRGSKAMDIEVTPYYIVKNSAISNTGRKINASFSVEKIITDANAKNVDEVFLYVSKTNLVASRNDIGGVVSMKGADIPDLNNVSLSRDVQVLTPDQSYVFARVGVKLAGVEYLIYSPVQKIQF